MTVFAASERERAKSDLLVSSRLAENRGRENMQARARKLKVNIEV